MKRKFFAVRSLLLFLIACCTTVSAESKYAHIKIQNDTSDTIVIGNLRTTFPQKPYDVIANKYSLNPRTWNPMGEIASTEGSEYMHPGESYMFTLESPRRSAFAFFTLGSDYGSIDYYVAFDYPYAATKLSFESFKSTLRYDVREEVDITNFQAKLIISEAQNEK